MRRGISTPVLALLLIVVLLIGVAIGYFIPRPGAAQTVTVTGAATTVTVTAPAAGGLPSEIPFGVIVSRSGTWASSGLQSEVIAKIAEKDINDFVKSIGLNVRFKFYFEDDETNPSLTLQRAQSLAAKGIKVIFGSLTSKQTKNLAEFANTQKVIVMSSASTAPRERVAPPGGYLFRITAESSTPDSKALLNVLKTLGIKYVVVITIDDTYNLAVRDAFVSLAPQYGVTVLLNAVYPPDMKDFSALLDQMEAAAKPYIDKGEKVAVFDNGWQEDLTLLLTQANARKSFLLNLQWITPDTIYPADVVLKNAADLASKVRVVCVQYTAPDTPLKRRIVETVKKEIGMEPDIWALQAYDAAWVLALSTLLAGKYDADAIKAAIPYVAKMYWGVSGNTELNEKNDRKSQSEEIWAVINNKMVLVGMYDPISDSITWYHPLGS
jgi:branched-chain amino acid transport system substrate-binding protein